MDITMESHYLVMNEDGSVVIENNAGLLFPKEENTYVYAKITKNIANEFGIPFTDDPRNVNNEEDTFTWQHKNTMLLLEQYKERTSKFRNPKIKKNILWEELSGIMKCHGYNVDADALDRKIRNMKNTYRTILDNNNKKKSTGRGRIQWEYFQIFQDIFQGDKTVNPAPVMASIQEAPVNEPVVTASAEPLLHVKEVEDAATSTSSRPSSPATNLTPSTKTKAKHLDMFRKRQLVLKEEKIAELKQLRKCIEENNQIQKEKVGLLRQMVELQASKNN